LITGAAAAAALALSAAAAGAEDPQPQTCLPSLKLKSGWCGDGGPAVHALLYSPSAVSAFADGSFVVMDSGPTTERGVRLAVVRRVRVDGTIEVAAGTGRDGSSGDGGPATAARISAGALAALPDGGFLLSETRSNRVRRVWADGTISTVAGTGRAGYDGDGSAATAAALHHPSGLAPLPDGGFLVADTGNARVRRVGPEGIISTVAGNGTRGTSGDWGPASAAALRRPTDVAALPSGGFAVVDEADQEDDDDLIRVVTAAGSIFTQVNVPNLYLCVCQDAPPDIAVGPGESLLFSTFSMVMRVSRNLHYEAVAGLPACGYSGDGGAAEQAQFAGVADIAPLPGGGYLLADAINSRVRRIDADGKVSTVAGGGGAPPRASAVAVARACKQAPLNPISVFAFMKPPRSTGGTLRVKLASMRLVEVRFTVYRGHTKVRGPIDRFVDGEDVIPVASGIKPGRYRVVAQPLLQGKKPIETIVKVTS
jgi:hypothetical protein